MKKTLSSVLLTLILTSGCASPATNILPVEQISSINSVSKDNSPVSPKIRLKIKKAEIEISEQDLNTQVTSILSLSDEKRLKDVKVTVMPDSNLKAEGTLLQKVPLSSNPLKLPFTIEGKLSAQAKNVIKYEVTKVKVAGLSVKFMMDLIEVELANIAKFKDSIGRIEMSGNNILLIVEKFTSDAIIDGQIKSIQSGDKSITVIF